MVDILADHIGLKVDLITNSLDRKISLSTRVRDYRDAERCICKARNGEADAVDRDRSLQNDMTQDAPIGTDREPNCVVVGFDAYDLAYTIDMPRNDVAAKSSICRHRTFYIDLASRMERSQIGAIERFMHDVSIEGSCSERRDGKANTIHSDAIPHVYII